jgi:hypothetical protein
MSSGTFDPFDGPGPVVLPVADDPNRCYVRTGECFYEVFLGDQSTPAHCECPDFTFRRRQCKHIRRAEAFRDLGGVEQATEEIDQWKQLTESEKLAVFR